MPTRALFDHPPASRRNTRLTLFVFFVHAVLGCLVFHALNSVLASDDTACVEAELASTASGDARLYFDSGSGLNEYDSSTARITGDGQTRVYTFLLSGSQLRALRFDPPDGGGTFTLSRLSVLPGKKAPPVAVPLSRITAENDIAQAVLGPDGFVAAVDSRAPDPQLLVILDDPLPIAGNKSAGPPLPLEAAAMLGLPLVILFALWRRQEAPAGLMALTGLLPGIVLGMMLALAVSSPLDSHPDEKLHVEAARFFTTAWLPPAVDDARIAPSLSKYGYSYLQDGAPVYWALGLASRVLNLAPTYHQSVRMLTLLMFAVLAAWLVRQGTARAPLLLALLCTPQLWYVFSYCNGDAFPAFLTLLAAALLADADNPVGRFMASPAWRGCLPGGLLLALIMGLAAISKANYLLAVAFLFGATFLDIMHSLTGRKQRLLKLACVAACVLAIHGLNTLHQNSINGFARNTRLTAHMELHARPEFKPSAAAKGEGMPTLKLRDKGVGLPDLFNDAYRWHIISFQSFTGVYGYMQRFSPLQHYWFSALVWLAFFAALVWALWRDGRNSRLRLALLLGGVALAVSQSVYFSWTSDFQAQGRYLFPILPMLLATMARLPGYRSEGLAIAFGPVFFLLGAWSFLFIALA
jgi:hypothetical protein